MALIRMVNMAQTGIQQMAQIGIEQMAQIGIEDKLLRTSKFQLEREGGMEEDGAMHEGGAFRAMHSVMSVWARQRREQQDRGKT